MSQWVGSNCQTQWPEFNPEIHMVEREDILLGLVLSVYL